MSFDYKSFLPNLPDLPGVYRMLGLEDQVLYVGKAKNLKKRVSSYFQKTLSSPRIAHMVGQIQRIETTVTRSEAEALLLENNLIKSLAPRYNILFRDDKSYPYISLTHGKFPRLAFFRGNPDRKADYFGPFPSGGAVKESIHLLQKMFRLRTCEESVFANRSRPCLLFQIRRCSGPCVDLISAQDYGSDVQLASLFLLGKQQEVIKRLTTAMEASASALAFEQAAQYRDQINALRAVQEKQYVANTSGDDVDVVAATREGGQLCVNLAMIRGGRHLGDRPQFPLHAGDASPEEAVAAFLLQHYGHHPAPARVIVCPMPQESELVDLLESIAQLAGRQVPVSGGRGPSHKAWVTMALQNAQLAILARNRANEQQSKRLQALQEALGLSDPLERLECFDISHTQGEATVASCVVYQGEGMRKSEYRRYNITDIQPGDDYAAMRQAITRRYDSLAAGEGTAPDLLLIDGGKGQVACAASALNELGVCLNMIGVAKGEGRKPGLETLIFPDERPPINLPHDHPALHLIQEIRDEAHRFAITGHRAQRGKTRKNSRLEDVPGIGPARRRALVAHFGGLSGVLGATIEQLASVAGISRDLAEQIYAYLHR